MNSILSLFTVAVAHAQLDLPPVVKNPDSAAMDFVCTVFFSWFFTAAIVLSIILALVAAFRYMTSGGEPAKVTLAHKTLVYVAIGVVVAIFARSLPVIVGGFIPSEKAFQLNPCTDQPAVNTVPGKSAP